MGIRFLILLSLLSIRLHAQFAADITITAIDNRYVNANMVNSTTKMINEINSAFNEKRIPRNPDRSLISEDAFKKILSLWEVSQFRVTQTQLILDGLRILKGRYQLRNIPVFFTRESQDSKEREIGFNFDASGHLTDCFLCLEMNTYKSLMTSGQAVKDATRSQFIAEFVELFRTAYNLKDITKIGQVLSDDALIITGKVIQVTAVDGELTRLPRQQVKYIRSSRSTYLNNLRQAFAANEYLYVAFDSAEVVQSVQNPDIYGVTLLQTWKSTHYSDQGWLFLMIDFKDDNNPQIHVRTWQPYKLDNQPITRRKAFHIQDFDVQAKALN